eukprot:6281339-Karenia_brevis.AAC.1
MARRCFSKHSWLDFKRQAELLGAAKEIRIRVDKAKKYIGLAGAQEKAPPLPCQAARLLCHCF